MSTTLYPSKRIVFTPYRTGNLPYVPKSNKSRKGDWIQTFTGRKFWPLDPRPGDWDIVDIAHSLSNHCRFGGHCAPFYSVAQHSIFVADRVADYLRKDALLHDAHESIYLDFPRPLKNCFPEYAAAEQRGAISLRKQFRIKPWFTANERGEVFSMHPFVKLVDNIALLTERRDLMTPTGYTWAEELERIKPDPHRIQPLPPLMASAAFMERFMSLI